MKRKTKIALTSLLVFSLVVVSTFAGGTKESETATIKGKPYQIVYVAKLVGIPWFNVTKEGMEIAGKELGVNVDLVGPAEPDAAQQARVVEDLIAKEVDAIIVMPNDTKMIDPILQKAREKGILVLTHESMEQQSCDYDIELLDEKVFGESFIDELVRVAGDKGGYAIMVGGLTVASHMLRMDYAVAHQKKNYPNLYQVTDRIPCSESVEQSHDKTLELLKAYPDLIGIISIGSMAPTGIANALKEKGAVGKVANIGATLPSMCAPYLKDGSMSGGLLYSPKDAGKAVVIVAKWLLDGNKIEDLTEVKGIGSGKVKLDGKVILLDGMIRITKENVDSWGF